MSLKFDLIERELAVLLIQLAEAGPEPIVERLKPRDSDYEAVFVGDAAMQMREGYVELWNKPPNGLARGPQREVRAFASEAQHIASTGEFPGGYTRIIDQLRPRVVWVRAKYVQQDGQVGMAYDGFVKLEDHWAWFPKPWRILSTPLAS